jgi:hypothetical protein
MKKKCKEKLPIICACDPHTSTPAFAVFQGRKLVAKKVLAGEPAKLLPEIKTAIDTWHPNLFIIENQYLPLSIDAIRRFRSVSSLIAARAMITAVFILSEVDCRIVEPFAWQQTLGGSGLGRDRLKALSVLKASAIAGERIEDHNLADAINLGFWYAANRDLGAILQERCR